jgi:hypothetical protein
MLANKQNYVNEDYNEDSNMESNGEDLLAKYRYNPPPMHALMARLKDLADSGSVAGIRTLIKRYQITVPAKELNKIARIDGYKFITRYGHLEYIKDTQYYRYTGSRSIDNGRNVQTNWQTN